MHLHMSNTHNNRTKINKTYITIIEENKTNHGLQLLLLTVKMFFEKYLTTICY